ncbi:MAG: SDR family oxidoreductase [Oscillospiraceae bacterium]|nr:SDR family oxidoreductase [Oscillospiraceae bacterium]
MEQLICLVTGGTSGIGREIACRLSQMGHRVYTLSRRPNGSDSIPHLSADLTDDAQVTAAIDQIYAAEGRLDLVVNNAGFGISGAVEFTSSEEALRQLDLNFFGMVRVNRAVLSRMREQGGGRIVNVSSVAGMIPIPFQTYYSASKAAINAYSLALANEVRPFGISVCGVAPGDVKTDFTASRSKNHQGDDLYGGRISRSVAGMEKDEEKGMSAQKVGKAICGIALKRKVRPIYVIGGSYRLLCVLAKILPLGLTNRIVGRLYAR